MALALNRENYVLHKIHSLTGIVPVGYYMVQHLVLNTFSIASPAAFDSVIGFFDGMPPYILLSMEVLLIWIPLLFHSIYGIFITGRAKPNFIGTKYGWTENRLYYFQRVSGILIFFFLIYHVISTTVYKYLTHDSSVVKYAAWHDKFENYGHALLFVYLIGVAACSYHLSYGLWNFCIRWGITISDKAQVQVQKVSLVCFLGLTAIGWAALAGFLMHSPTPSGESVMRSRPAVSSGVHAQTANFN